MGLFGTCANAFKWGFAVNTKNIGRWILLIILSIIPIVNLIAIGAYLKILKGEEPDLSPVGRNFLNGLLRFFIGVIYALIPIVLAVILGAASILPAIIAGGNDVGVAIGNGVGILGIVITLIVTLLLCLIEIPAKINFARTGKFSKAFAFREIFGMIKSIGWGKYILAIIVLLIFAIIISLILSLFLGILGIIPVVGLIVEFIIYFIVIVPLFCFEYKYWNDVFV